MSQGASSIPELPDDVWIRLGKEKQSEFDQALTDLAKELGSSEEEILKRVVAAAYREALG